MPTIPLLDGNSFRILGIKKENPKLSSALIAAKTGIPVDEVTIHLNSLRRAKLLNDGADSTRKLKCVK